jgi:hypothetical protein
MTNNTISQNHCVSTTMTTYGAGLTIAVGSAASGWNNILYGNTAMFYPDLLGTPAFTYSCCPQGIAGTGNITNNPLFVLGPFGSFYLSQIAAGQSSDSPCVDVGNPASPMVTGTTRTDQIQDAGIIDMGYHYPILSTTPAVNITLLPVNPPIIIPPQGGSFDWDITLHNNETTPQTIDVWTIITLPNGSTRPGWGPFLNLTMAAGATINRVRTQIIVERYPPGDYTYTGNIGDYPNVVWDSDSFPFTKLLGGDGGWAGEKACDGQGSAALAPAEYALLGATPNPFNPITTLSFALPQAGLVKLSVYSVSGQEVATLVNGWRDAGIHEVTFDASNLASGLYVYQLTAGEFHATGKLVLMK